MVKYTQKGFTLVELIIIMGIFSFLLGFITINLINARKQASINATITTLTSDVKQQQVKSMLGDNSGTVSNNGYGIYFEPNQYTLFKGSSHSPSDNLNLVIELDGLEFSNVSFSGSKIVFLPGSGEVEGFIDGSNTITIRNIQSNEEKIITINRYGVVTGVN